MKTAIQTSNSTKGTIGETEDVTFIVPGPLSEVMAGVEYFVYLLKGKDHRSHAGFALRDKMKFITAEDIGEMVDTIMSSILPPEALPLVKNELLESMEDISGDLAPGLLRGIPKPPGNELFYAYAEIDEPAKDKVAQYASEYARNQPTREDGTPIPFDVFCAIHANNHIDQLNAAVCAINKHKGNIDVDDRYVHTINLTAPIYNHHQYKVENKEINALINILAGTYSTAPNIVSIEFILDTKSQSLNVSLITDIPTEEATWLKSTAVCFLLAVARHTSLTPANSKVTSQGRPAHISKAEYLMYSIKLKKDQDNLLSSDLFSSSSSDFEVYLNEQ